MLAQPPLWLIVLAFLGSIGVLVFVHEMGHYLVGRWCGIGAKTFSIGFGREIAGWTDGRGTRWKIGWLPLGGYVRFEGDMDPASMGRDLDMLTPQQRAVSFHAKPVWQRFLVVLAGPAANFLLAVLIFAGFFLVFGAPRTPPVVAMVAPQSAAAKAGLQVGDRILEMDGRQVKTFNELGQYTVLRPGERVLVRLQRSGQVIDVPVTLGTASEVDRFGQIYRVGRLGVAMPPPVYQKVGPLRALPEGVQATWQTTRSMAEGLWQLVTGRRPLNELHGAMKMAQIAGQYASVGPFEFIQLLALFSINLGFINLLPVPMLDGGHLALYTVEAVRRRPLGERAQEWVFRGGMAALLTLFLFTTFNDLGSFGLWEQIGQLTG
ncbi:RIP metalloprotease RseP [Sphingomonas sp. BN140010]|uniref:Zinc metalloprotease n=1 Tax=Sphingomonas arvum TaxID=2992113 RepID=A0ABT3JEH6_9SPHN|nr:RIP metalloprotease RseP [Sphingomonas sp. BN140010]MCW3797472.1 RIP metalloprotease RseP [Sphingomonas sp. BN140010]